MLKLIKKYNQFFDLCNAKNLPEKVLFGFMLTLPHIITCLILMVIFPLKWIGIIIVGLILPDLSYFIYIFTNPILKSKKNFNLDCINKHRKKIAHLITFIVIIFLLMNGEYVLFFAGAIHLLLDMVGF